MSVTMIMMIGPSYCGKSTVAEKYAKKYCAEIFSSDAIREEIYGSADEQKNPGRVFDLLHTRLKTALKAGRNVIYDATNLTYKRRMAFIREINALHIDVEKIAVVVVATIDAMKTRAKQRERVVPWHVVDRQLRQFQCPGLYEGWDNIIVESTSSVFEKQIFFQKIAALAKDMEHDNPHHTHNVDDHMTETSAYATSHYEAGRDFGMDALTAYRFHDIGKVYTKTFNDCRSRPSEIAHFYNHENYGAYIMLLWPIEDYDLIEMALLVQWHMAHYYYPEKKLNQLYDWMKQEGYYKELKILEESDVHAH